MVKRKKIFKVNTKFINTTIGKGKLVVSEGVAYSKLLYVSLLLNLVTILVVFLSRRILPPEVPLLYGLAEGDGQLIDRNGLLLPSLISIIIVLMNTAISLIISDGYLQKALVVTAFASSIIATVAIVETMFLVGKI